MTGLGGGIARKGSLCGALLGGVLSLGMKMGRTDPQDKESITKIFEKIHPFWDQFEKEFGSRDCYTLTGFHLESPEEVEKYKAAGGKEKCHAIIEKTAQMLYRIMNGI
jgi:C_GCAxxG_C_C family probable redox protein